MPPNRPERRLGFGSKNKAYFYRDTACRQFPGGNASAKRQSRNNSFIVCAIPRTITPFPAPLETGYHIPYGAEKYRRAKL